MTDIANYALDRIVKYRLIGGPLDGTEGVCFESTPIANYTYYRTWQGVNYYLCSKLYRGTLLFELERALADLYDSTVQVQVIKGF